MMKVIWKIILLTLIIHTKGFSQTIDTVSIDSLITTKFKENIFNGVVLISKNDSILFQKSYGYENLERKTPFSAKSRFQIASISKQFTAFGILYLQEQNKLNIYDSVVKYLPKFPFKDITIHHLLNHTSGLPNFSRTMIKDLDKHKVNGNAQMLDMLSTGKYPLQWKPGEKWQYSDIGYCTLATIIEKVSGQRFDVFMKDNLFTPAGMQNTTAEMYTDFRKINQENLSTGYISDTDKKTIDIAYKLPKYNFIYYLGGFYGDGSVVTTTEDLLKWDKALYKGNIISKKSIKLALTPKLLNNGENIDIRGKSYGYGWFLYDNTIVGQVQTHSGGHPGYSSRMTRCPEKKLTIIMLSNFSIPRFGKFNLLNKIIDNHY